MRLSARNTLVAVLVLWVGIAGCKKREDTILPLIVIESPTVGASVSVPNSILVEATVMDERGLEWVSVTLVNEALQPAFSTVTFDATGTQYDLVTEYSLAGATVATGNYYLRVKASDGRNEQSELVAVTVQAVPRERLGLVLASAQNGTTTLSLAQPFGTVEPFATVNTDLSGLAVSSADQTVAVAGRYDGQVTALRVADQSQLWTVSDLPDPPFPAYVGFGFQGSLSYLCIREGGWVKGYDGSGISQFVAETDAEHYPASVYLHEDLLFTEEYAISGSGRQFGVYWQASGAQRQLQPLELDNVVGWASLDVDRAYVFGNESGEAKVLEYHVTENNFNEPRNLPDGIATDALKIQADMILLVIAGDIHRYDPTINSITLLSSNGGYEKLVYDELNGVLFASGGSTVWQVNTQTGVATLAVSASAPIEFLEVLFNY